MANGRSLALALVLALAHLLVNKPECNNTCLYLNLPLLFSNKLTIIFHLFLFLNLATHFKLFTVLNLYYWNSSMLTFL